MSYAAGCGVCPFYEVYGDEKAARRRKESHEASPEHIERFVAHVDAVSPRVVEV